MGGRRRGKSVAISTRKFGMVRKFREGVHTKICKQEGYGADGGS